MNAKEHEKNIGASNNNMRIFKDKDGIFKHKEVASFTSTSVPIPEVVFQMRCFMRKCVSLRTSSQPASVTSSLRQPNLSKTKANRIVIRRWTKQVTRLSYVLCNMSFYVLLMFGLTLCLCLVFNFMFSCYVMLMLYNIKTNFSYV